MHKIPAFCSTVSFFSCLFLATLKSLLYCPFLSSLVHIHSPHNSLSHCFLFHHLYLGYSHYLPLSFISLPSSPFLSISTLLITPSLIASSSITSTLGTPTTSPSPLYIFVTISGVSVPRWLFLCIAGGCFIPTIVFKFLS